MDKDYLGHLSRQDPAYQYFREIIQPAAGPDCPGAEYRVFRLHGSNAVYLYEETHTRTRFVGKFFQHDRQHDPHVARKRMENEFQHLAELRAGGFAELPHYVARPLGCNAALNHLLVVEHCRGELFSSILQRSFARHDAALLYRKLTALAGFLCHLHNRTAAAERVNFQEGCHYLDTLLNQLRSAGLLNWEEGMELCYYKDLWRCREMMWADCQVMVHGDATPDNFLLGEGEQVISFDLERLHRADRVFDVGRMAGELAHFFLLSSGDRGQAEPYIGHFLWEYCRHFPDQAQSFAAITERLPFYLGANLLRIARNDWLSWDYRKRLICEAKSCLRCAA